MLTSFQNNSCHWNSICKKSENNDLLKLISWVNRCQYIANKRWNYTLHPRFLAQILHLSFFFLMKGNNLPCCRNYHSSFLFNINRWCQFSLKYNLYNYSSPSMNIFFYKLRYNFVIIHFLLFKSSESYYCQEMRCCVISKWISICQKWQVLMFCRNLKARANWA